MSVLGQPLLSSNACSCLWQVQGLVLCSAVPRCQPLWVSTPFGTGLRGTSATRIRRPSGPEPACSQRAPDAVAGRASRRLTGSLVAPDVSSRCRPAGRQQRQTSVWRSWSQSASARGSDPYPPHLRGWDRDFSGRLHVPTGRARPFGVRRPQHARPLGSPSRPLPTSESSGPAPASESLGRDGGRLSAAAAARPRSARARSMPAPRSGGLRWRPRRDVARYR